MKRRIVVTGAASGIGATTAALLEANGDEVIMLDLRQPGGPGKFVACDLGREESIEQAVAAISGPIDGLANIAGLPGTHTPERILAVNFLGTRALTLGLVGKLREGASVVLVSSIAAHRCSWTDERLQALLTAPSWVQSLAQALQTPMNGGEAYELSKRLLNFWLPEATATFAAQGVRVNVVSPGPVDTPILPDFRISMGEARIDAAEQLVGRHARPEEIAHVLVFLLSGQAGWINGIDIRVDGGLYTLREATERSLGSLPPLQ
jgi:NAD(P)-dependent dehydrogenase (short-subunit alcohol dehydrogenase family)